MAEILVKAVSVAHPDPEKDRRGTHKKGDLVVVMPDGHPWGAREGPPRFVRVLCPEVTVEQVRDRVEPWRWRPSFEIVSSNIPQDRYRIRATNATMSQSGAAAFTLSRVEAFLTRWGAAIVSSDDTSVTFDIRIFDALTSRGFWVVDVTSVAFTETDYDRTTGEHTIQADYSAHPGYQEHPVSFSRGVRSRVESLGGLVLSQEPGVIIYQMDRSDARARFREDVQDSLGTWRRHRHHFSEADVDQVLDMGGEITVTATQLAAAVLDRLTE